MDENNKRKSDLIMYCIGGVIIAFIGYLAGGTWKDGDTIFTWSDGFQYALQHPFERFYWNSNVPKVIFVCLFVYFVFVLQKMTEKQFMYGKEYGTAKWGSWKKINKKFKDPEDIHRNRIYSHNIRFSTNNKFTRINNNCFVIGGSGAGKSFHLVKPNLNNLNGSVVVTDPKGELLRDCGAYLKEHGYDVKVLNINKSTMTHSDCYNPFKYIRSENDITALVTNIIANTSDENATKGDPFWEKSEIMFSTALMLYVWTAEPPERQNFNTFVELLHKAQVMEDGDSSELDDLFDDFALKYGEDHPAYIKYKDITNSAEDTVRSIFISAKTRYDVFANEDVMRILSKDELDLATLGIGKNGDQKTKTALFCVISDSDKTFNFLAGMLYTQLFQELYFQADFNFGGSLPIEVTFWLDEFANVALPENFLSLLSTMRSRGISSVIIIQNLAQIKGMYKEGKWEIIPGNCDTTIYLGGNEQSTFEYLSKKLGDATIYKKNSSESKGRNGSTSQSTDAIGRKLKFENEIGEFSNDKCMVFIRGEKPIQDYKFKTVESEEFKESCKLGAYEHDNGLEFDEFDVPKRNVNGKYVTHKKEPSLLLLNEASYNYYKKQSKLNDNIKLYDLTDDEVLEMFINMTPDKSSDNYRDFDEAKQDEEKEHESKNDINTLTTTGEEIIIEDDDNVQDIIRKNPLKDETIDLITVALENHVNEYHIGKILECNNLKKAKVLLKGFIVSAISEKQNQDMIAAMNEREELINKEKGILADINYEEDEIEEDEIN